MLQIDQNKKFEQEINVFLKQSGHLTLKRRTFQLQVKSDQLEFILYLHRETGMYSGWFSADLGIRHPLADEFGWFGIEKFAPKITENSIWNARYDCLFRFSTAQIPGAGNALFDQKGNYQAELDRFKRVVRDLCVPEFEKIGDIKRYYEMLVFEGESQWYGEGVRHEISSHAGSVVALGRMLGFSEQQILRDLCHKLEFFKTSNVGRMNPSMDGKTYVATMFREWDSFASSHAWGSAADPR